MAADARATPAWIICAVSLALLLSINTAAASDEIRRVEAQARGRSLYIDGRHADGHALKAGNGDIDLPQPFVACVNCHGYEARGRTEGGSASSDIRWEMLTKPYDIVRSDGRRRAPYNAATFFTALTEGRDAGGHALDAAMPRFALSIADADDLFAYLEYLASPGDQGVSDDAIRVGIVVPTLASADTGPDRRLLAAWFNAINDGGGIFRRRIELIPMDLHQPGAAPTVLAMLDISASGASASDNAAARGIPSIHVVADAMEQHDRYRFALNPGTVDRARVLARYAIARDPAPQPRLALLYPEQTTAPDLLAAVIAALKPLAAVMPIPVASARGDAAMDALSAEGVANALVLGSGADVETLLTSARRPGWDPLLLWIERPHDGAKGVRAVTTEPALIDDVTAEAGASYAHCVDLAATTERDRTRQLALLASARLLVTALEQGGRDITRERLVETLHSLREFRSGFAPPGSLSPQRHTAASGVYVVPLPTSEFQPDAEWMTLD